MKMAVSGEYPGRKYNLKEIAEFIKNYGAKAIEIWPENIPEGEGSVSHRLFKNRRVDEAKAILDNAGLEVACVAFGGAFNKEIASDEELYSQELARAVDVAAYLGAKIVNHYLYYLCMDDKADIERLKRIYAPAIERAEQQDVILALEVEAHDSTKDPVEMLRIVRSMGSKCFKTNYDAVNYFQASYEGYPYAYEVLKEEIAHVHIKDGCKYVKEHGHKIECRGGLMSGRPSSEEEYIYYPIMGKGFMNNHELLKRLQEDGYSGWCTLEPHAPPELWHDYIRTEISYLKNTGLF
jgi:sugar phosphate isomerase/epimerase